MSSYYYCKLAYGYHCLLLLLSKFIMHLNMLNNVDGKYHFRNNNDLQIWWLGLKCESPKMIRSKQHSSYKFHSHFNDVHTQKDFLTKVWKQN
jgi:hypothetical protein